MRQLKHKTNLDNNDLTFQKNNENFMFNQLE